MDTITSVQLAHLLSTSRICTTVCYPSLEIEKFTFVRQTIHFIRATALPCILKHGHRPHFTRDTTQVGSSHSPVDSVFQKSSHPNQMVDQLKIPSTCKPRCPYQLHSSQGLVSVPVVPVVPVVPFRTCLPFLLSGLTSIMWEGSGASIVASWCTTSSLGSALTLARVASA